MCLNGDLGFKVDSFLPMWFCILRYIDAGA